MPTPNTNERVYVALALTLVVALTVIGSLYFRQDWSSTYGSREPGDLFRRDQGALTPGELGDIVFLCGPVATCMRPPGCTDSKEDALLKRHSFESDWGEQLMYRLTEDGYENVRREFAGLLREEGLSTRSADCRYVAYTKRN